MALDMVDTQVGMWVSEIEKHTNLNDRIDCTHHITKIELFPHGKYHHIHLSGYSDEDRETEKFSEFQLYPIDVSGMRREWFETHPNINSQEEIDLQFFMHAGLDIVNMFNNN